MIKAENTFPIAKYCLMATLLIILTSCRTFTNRAKILEEIIDLNPETGEIYYHGQPWETWEMLDLDQAVTMIETLPAGDVRLGDDGRVWWRHRTFNTTEALFFDDSDPLILNVTFSDSGANPRLSQITEKLGRPHRVVNSTIALDQVIYLVDVAYKFPNHIAIFTFRATRLERIGCETTNLYSLHRYKLVRADEIEELDEFDKLLAVKSKNWVSDFEIDGENMTICS